MTVNNKFSFEAAVQSLACVLAQIKPTPWEKVSALIKRPSMGKSIIDFMRKKNSSHPNFIQIIANL